MIAVIEATDHDQIIMGLIALLATLVTGLVYMVKTYTQTKVAATKATGAYEAVNGIGPGEHRLYDKVTHLDNKITEIALKQDDFDTRGWPSLPADLATSAGLTEVIRDLQHAATLERTDHDAIIVKLDQMEAEIRQHVAWEMAEKWKSEGHQ